MKVKKEKCNYCNGSGKVDPTKPNSTIPEKCPTCEGKGFIEKVEFEKSQINNN